MKHQALSPSPQTAEDAHQQYAALCWRAGRSGPEILLITSRDSGRWVIPKGWPIKGLSPADVAAREAWEEAGVKGRKKPYHIGQFSYDKVLNRTAPDQSSLPCVVSVYALEVTDIAKQFPEKGQRQFVWLSPTKAALNVNEDALQALLSDFCPDRGCPPPSVRAQRPGRRAKGGSPT